MLAVDDASTLASGLLALRGADSAAMAVASGATVGSGTSFGDGAPPV